MTPNRKVFTVRPVDGTSSLTQQVIDSVREAILSGELRPGELYSVYQLAAQLNVSRTPVREAMLRLAEAGMVRFERSRGFRVLRRDPREIAEVFHLRLLLEVPAARLAARRAGPELVESARAELEAMRAAAKDHDEPRFMRHDRAFHRLLLTAGANRKLVGMVDNLRDATITLGASTVDRSRSLADIAEEHEPILAALEARDPEAVAGAMRAHVSHTGELLLAQVATEAGVAADPADIDLLHAT
ncbi:DNA-binding GntR family transcriptional regulator [Thermocatellispora tengchongensis]|uniref:DNA-binding GntR family transcriptional regulator n=1 Tax=Thermocatellispora tengchongensis TaxID=1073253 RepID=A0A840NX64_9ACTN|nr:GntR family transcriptional regulator [Thermocatellispora tengchongensis]MBB5132108.1 DNA-binding GntR family transcriptional regulator [Thermocatellispora tengchongensis]